MKITINKKIIILYFVLLTSFANASLRLTSHGMTSIFRMLSPLFFLILVNENFGKYLKEIIALWSIFIYSILVSILLYHHIEYSYYIFIMYIYIELIIVRSIKKIDKKFEKNYWSFLNTTSIFTVAASYLQMLFHFRFPYVKKTLFPAVNLWFDNENSLCIVLASMAIIYIWRALFKNEKKEWIKCFLIFPILYFNDGKLSMIAVVVSGGMQIIYRLLQDVRVNNRAIRSGVILAIECGIGIIGVIFLFTYNPTFSFLNQKMKVSTMFFDTAKGIITVTPLQGFSSIIVRTNAIIYGLKELSKTHFLGMGIGNTVYMLTMDQYKMRTIESMHNLLVQFLCECGIIAIGIYCFAARQIAKIVRSMQCNCMSILKFFSGIGFIFISMQDSIGILSNYHVWAILFYVILV